MAPVPADPGKLVRTKVKTELGDYRGYYANVRDAINGVAKLAVTAGGWVSDGEAAGDGAGELGGGEDFEGGVLGEVAHRARWLVDLPLEV